MKILQLPCHYLPNIGGVETHLHDLVSELSARGNDVFVLTYLPLTTPASAKIWESTSDSIKHTGKVNILRLPWLRGLFYSFVQHPIIEFLYLFPPLFIILPFILLIYNPRVIHAHGLVAGTVAVIWGKIFMKRVVISTHSVYHFPKKSLYTSFASKLFRSSDAVLTLSHQSALEIQALGISKDKVHQFTYWLDLDLFKRDDLAKKKLKFEGKFVVLFVGRLVQEKGILIAIEAAQNWPKDCLLVIVGIGPLVQQVSLNKSPNVLYAGKIDQKNLPLYYSSADVTLVPSIHDEGFGRVILESLACSTPVIAADKKGIREAMNDSVGEIIHISPETITKTVNKLRNNKQTLKSYSQQSRKFVEQNYSKANIDVILQTYEQN
ncbi:MAG TPA: glycosyltransferase family 4 protein [Patescibacteria group bacterium]|nr:glycosyltransferase family 4 protein [Patescibacteria group bacterium]